MTSSLLPSTQSGHLPYFLLYASISALIHSAVTYTNPVAALKQFSGASAPAKTPLLAHLYGIKNVYTGLIRVYAAYNINNRPVYDLATATFVGVLFLYITECFWFKTVGLREATFPFVTAGVGLVWMVHERGAYV
ncbi:hypothetical protein BJX61DRAFT_542332 [Aspergillus egyptiacus]|nr:hypothetical protein BJX61DRAFT_542332 [Aspergillus egyptiacus]